MSAQSDAAQPESRSESAELFGLLAEFESVDDLLKAARGVRDAGYKRWDVHSPFPVHGLDQAMGLKRTRLPLVVFGGGATGALGALVLQWWTNAVDYPFVISGKPFFSLPANIPVIFELTVLFAAFGAFFGMLMFNGLPELYHALFSSDRFRRVTTDGLFICIEAKDPGFDRKRTADLLLSLGASHLEELRD